LVRVLVSLAIGVSSAALAAWPRFLLTRPGGDFAAWAVRAARDLVAGQDPYRYKVTVNAVPYPLPAAFIGFPFAALSDRWAGAAFSGCSAALLAYGLTRDRQWWRLLLFASYPYVESLRCVQWSPLLMAAACYPLLLPLVLMKPHLGIALLAKVKITAAGVALTILTLLASLAIDPGWPRVWFWQASHYRGLIPLGILPVGPALALVLLRWRQRDAYYLLLLAALPKRIMYDHLLLFLIPGSAASMAGLAALSWATWYLSKTLGYFPLFLVCLMYVPTMLMVLARGRKKPVARGSPPALS
jgi:hypothetical protein